MKEERFPHTRNPFSGRDCGWRRWGPSEPRRRVQQQGCGRQSREIPAQRIGADQHSPAREACLLTRRGGRGLGAEARASEVGSQGEDWGWLREHRLKGASVSQLDRKESGKKSGTAKRQEPFSCLFASWCARRGDSERRLKELQRQA